jgi:hypothetical protein
MQGSNTERLAFVGDLQDGSLGAYDMRLREDFRRNEPRLTRKDVARLERPLSTRSIHS